MKLNNDKVLKIYFMIMFFQIIAFSCIGLNIVLKNFYSESLKCFKASYFPFSIYLYFLVLLSDKRYNTKRTQEQK